MVTLAVNQRQQQNNDGSQLSLGRRFKRHPASKLSSRRRPGSMRTLAVNPHQQQNNDQSRPYFFLTIRFSTRRNSSAIIL